MLGFTPDDPRVRYWREESDPRCAHLDVRELLADGGEPYAIIMECVHTLEAGERLVLHALMQPRPLLAQLHRLGYVTVLRHAGPDHWEVEIGLPV